MIYLYLNMIVYENIKFNKKFETLFNVDDISSILPMKPVLRKIFSWLMCNISFYCLFFFSTKSKNRVEIVNCRLIKKYLVIDISKEFCRQDVSTGVLTFYTLYIFMTRLLLVKDFYSQQSCSFVICSDMCSSLIRRNIRESL